MLGWLDNCMIDQGVSIKAPGECNISNNIQWRPKVLRQHMPCIIDLAVHKTGDITN